MGGLDAGEHVLKGGGDDALRLCRALRREEQRSVNCFVQLLIIVLR